MSKVYLLRVSDEQRLPFKGYITDFEDSFSAKSLFVGKEGKKDWLDSLVLSDELSLELVFSAKSPLFEYVPNRAVARNGKVTDKITGNAICFKRDESGRAIDITEDDVKFLESCLIPIRAFLGEFCEAIDPAILPVYDGGE